MRQWLLEFGEQRKLADFGVADIVECQRVYNGYPTEKPVDVSDVLVSQCTQPGEPVIDPFMGSGSVGVTALRLGGRFGGADMCGEAIDVATRRFTECGATVGPWAEPRPAQGTLLGVG